MQHIACVSFGKDSLATVILAKEHGEPLDAVVYSEVMFDKDTSGEVPEHRDFIYNVAIPKLESWGIPTIVLRAEKTFLDCFYHKRTKSKIPERNGKYYGFPMVGGCFINSRCKSPPLDSFIHSHPKVKEYVGIAADEPKRLKRLDGSRKISLLAKYGVTEQGAAELCKRHGLLSPVYDFSSRNGCWFCPNASYRELRHLRNYHPELWKKLLDLQGEPNIVRKGKFRIRESLFDIEDMFANEDAQMCFEEYLKICGKKADT